jgi:hypothetical protein
MPLLGKAAVAMWWDIAPVQRGEFEDWHSHEHFPERMGIPGFLRGSRWHSLSNAEGFFVMYELAGYETLTSPHYVARLNDPTPWSTKMMPHHRNMVRSQCRAVASYGGGLAGSIMTLRLSPQPGQADGLQHHLMEILGKAPDQPGVTGSHLLRTETPDAAVTKEQTIRGGADAVADWIVLVAGYDAQALVGLAEGELGTAALAARGAQPVQIRCLYRLSYALTADDL